MKAAVVHSFSAAPRCESFSEPVPSGEEVLVTVAAAGLHPIVKSLAAGTHYSSTSELPFVAGMDGVGRLADGSRVYFARSRPLYGSFAERSLTQRATCFPVPENLSDVTVAAIMNPGMSSWGALTERTQLAPGESVLIPGATGVAGRLAVQVARRLGARRVVAAGRNPQALEELRGRAAGACGVALECAGAGGADGLSTVTRAAGTHPFQPESEPMSGTIRGRSALPSATPEDIP